MKAFVLALAMSFGVVTAVLVLPAYWLMEAGYFRIAITIPSKYKPLRLGTKEGWFNPRWGIDVLDAQPRNGWEVGGRVYSTRDLMGRKL